MADSLIELGVPQAEVIGQWRRPRGGRPSGWLVSLAGLANSESTGGRLRSWDAVLAPYPPDHFCGQNFPCRALAAFGGHEGGDFFIVMMESECANAIDG